MIACIGFFQRTDLLIVRVIFLVGVGIRIQVEHRTGQEAQERILVFLILLFHRGRFFHSFGFSYLHTAADQGVFHTDLNMLSVCTDIYMVLLRAYCIKVRGRDLLDDPVSVRNVLKGKTAIFSGNSSKQRIFFSKFFGIRSKQSHERTGQRDIFAAFRVFPNFYTVYMPAEKFIGNSLAFIDKDLYQGGFLSGIFKDDRIFLIRKDIGAVGRAFLDIIAAKRQIGSEGSAVTAGFIRRNRDHFQKSICRDHAAICRRQVCGSIKSKGNILIFLVHAKTEQVIGLHCLEKCDIHFLPFVIKTCRCLCDLHGLARIGQFHIFRLRIQHTTGRSLTFLQTVTAKIEKPAFRCAVLAGRKGFHNRIFFCPQGTVTGINIFICDHVIDRSGKSGNLIHRLVQSVVSLDRSKYFSGLCDGKLAFLRHIVLSHRHNRLAAVNGKRYRLIGKHIAIRGSHLIKFIIPGGQRLRQHQPALVRNIEGIQCFRVRIVDGLGDKFPSGKILDLKTGSGHRDNLSGLCVTFFNFQTGCDGAVVQDIAVSLSVRGNEYRKVRDKGFAFLACDLMDRIMPIRKRFTGSKTIRIRGKNVTFTFLCRVIASGCL